MTENEEVEKDIKETIDLILKDWFDADEFTASEVSNEIYDSIWEYIKEYD